MLHSFYFQTSQEYEILETKKIIAINKKSIVHKNKVC